LAQNPPFFVLFVSCFLCLSLPVLSRQAFKKTVRLGTYSMTHQQVAKKFF
jgi:hypothetical protein